MKQVQEMVPHQGIVGSGMPIQDAASKVTGQLRYTSDLKLPHMLYGKILFSPVAHARIKHIDLSRAQELAGVRAVVFYGNAPQTSYNGCGEQIDQDKTERIFDQTVRYVGDRVAAVAADTPQIAEAALRLIEVEYESLPAYFTPEEAMADDACAIHPGGNILHEVHSESGDLEEGFARAAHVFEDCYELPAVHHGALETHGSLAHYGVDGKLTIYSGTQDPFGMRLNLARLFDLPMSRVRVVSPPMGGSFGGKIDMVTEPVSALLSIRSGRPVRISLTRREEIPSSRTRHAMKLTLRTGVLEDGTITAQDIYLLINAGAYAGATMSIAWGMCDKAFKLNQVSNVRFHAIPVYTNTPIAAAMRGFGSPQLAFAQQRQLNRIANVLGIDVRTLTSRNLIYPWDNDPRNGFSLGNARPGDCVERGSALFNWEAVLQEQKRSAQDHGRYRIGVGMAVGVHGNGLFGILPDTTGVILKMNEDGTVVLNTGSCDMGNGCISVQMQMISEVLDIPREQITWVPPDTDAAMADMGSYSSRGVFVSGHAVMRVACQVRERLLQEGAELLNKKTEELELKGGKVSPKGKLEEGVTLAEIMRHAKQNNQRDICCADTFASFSRAHSYGAHFAKVQVDIQTGDTKVLDYVAVHDVGRAVNPLSVEGQIEGAIQMGLGYALRERLEMDPEGRVRNNSFRTYRMFQADEMPPIRVGVVEELEPTGPFGAKSIGECAIVPCAPAIVNAISNAIGAEFHCLPVTPERVREACQGES